MKINIATPSASSNQKLVLDILQLIQSEQIDQAEAKIKASQITELPANMRPYLEGLCAERRGEFERSAHLHNQAIELDDRHPFAYSGLANALLKIDRRANLSNARTLVQAEYNLHQRLASLEQLLTLTAEAEDWPALEPLAKTMLAQQAGNTTALMSLGLAVLEQAMARPNLDVDALSKSIQAFLLALKVNPNLANAHKGLAKAFSTAGELKTAEQHYLKAYQLNSNDSESLMAAGLSKVCHKELADGWSMVSKRSEFGTVRYGMDTSNFNACPAPLWKGENTSGKRILITTEQGIGDQILFGQLVQELCQRGAKVTLTCSPKIQAILQRSLNSAHVLKDTPPLAQSLLEQQDYKASLLELAQYLRPTSQSLENKQAYLLADPILVKQTADKYQQLFGKKIRVGIAWRSHTDKLGELKSTELEQWLTILKTPDVQFINTQYKSAPSEIETIKARYGITIFQDDFDPFDDCERALAQLANLDLLISVSNSGVHMAGQLGIPTWVLINKTPIWHWFAEGETSPWYDSVRLFRQTLPGNWQQPLADIKQALDAWLASPKH